ncbi:unnamed protein product, partial [Mesorhabditis belari]|uniref:YLPM1-like spectrin repeat domain-containing protein n=1 Tax=Mesorhabditis belari TaxID=2138241 RepID=A0AAF3EL22_9BILA
MSKNAEEELEKQYREYKIQFDAWKEKNKGSQGTDAYNAYVKQFENWEKDVEKRRKTIRDKAEHSAKEAAEVERERERLKRESDEQERKLREEQARKMEADRIAAQQRSAAEAAAYAQSQQAYLAHHQAGLEQDHILRAVHMQTTTIQYTQPVHHPHSSSHMAAVDEVNAQNVLQQMAEVVMGNQVQEKPAVYQQQPPQQAANPPQLWGNTKPVYDSRDPLWAKWGVRASPAHQPPPPSTLPIVPPPYWMVLDSLKERKLIIAPTAAVPVPFLK